MCLINSVFRQTYRVRLITLFLIFFGLGIRVATIKSTGGVDSEWWKAWMSATHQFGLLGIYTDVPDSQFPISSRWIVTSYLQPFPIFEGQRVVDFITNDYDRVQFPITQPPLFLLELNFVEHISRLLQAPIMNSLGLNSPYVALNASGLIWTVLLLLVVRLIYSELLIPHPTILATGTVWLNPAVILSSPIQGFRDIPMLTFLSISTLMIIRGNKTLGGTFFGIALMTKLTSIFALPGMIWTKLNRRFLSAILISTIVVLLPYVLHGRFIGLLQGQVSNLGNLRRVNGDISIWSWLQLLNVQYLDEIGQYGSPLIKTSANLIPTIALVLQILIVGTVVFRLRRVNLGRINEKDLIYWVVGFAISFAVHATRLNAQDNHWIFILATFFPAIVFKPTRLHLLAIVFILTIQDIVGQGFGRSYLEFIWTALHPYSGELTVALSLISIVIFVNLLVRIESEIARK